MVAIAREPAVEDELQDQISGSVDWHQKSCTISPSGIHWLKWRYTKDTSSSSGSDCGPAERV